MNTLGMGERAPWRQFPAVVRNGDLGSLKGQPEYAAAKAGDQEAALNLVDRLLTDDMLGQLRDLIGDSKPRLLPVLAVEEAGTNRIPLAMAEVIADRLGLDVELGITQYEKVSRTDAGSDHRLAFNPTFEGPVEPGQTYLIVDDTLTMGGTVSSLRGYVENRGGSVIGAAVMTAHAGALDLPVKPGMLAGISAKHGEGMNDFWKETFGYGIDQLTQGEAGHLKAAASVDALRARILAARNEGIERLDAGRAAAPALGAQPVAGTDQDVDAGDQGADQSADVLEVAQDLEREQQSSLEAAPVEQTYQENLELYVEAKHDQVGRLADRLESMIEQQEARMQQAQTAAPGLLSLPGTKRAWQAQQTQQQARLQSLHNRLEAVREIKEGMGVHGPRVDELATRKMRADHPELASDWDAMQEAARRQQTTSRNERNQERNQERASGQERGRTNTLGRTPT